MQQRQPRLGDILDDYCPRERRLTNHAVVAMIGEDIRLTRCTTCESEHDYKHARVPRLHKKSDIALGPPAGVPVPKRVILDLPASAAGAASPQEPLPSTEPSAAVFDDVPAAVAHTATDSGESVGREIESPAVGEGPVHRPLIRAQLPKLEGQPPAVRQAPDFTIRQPAGRPGRFRPRPQRGGGMFSNQGDRNQGDRSNGNVTGNGDGRGGGMRPAGRPPVGARGGKRQGGGRKRSK
jgi:hypothetical protein